MGKANKLYPFGFIFTEKSNDIKKLPLEYKELKVLDNFLYYCNEDCENLFFVKGEKFIVINGHFTHVGVEKDYNNEELLEELLYLYFNYYDEFLNLLDFIGGRYAIIIGNNKSFSVYQDATGARSVYYTLDKNVISSHLNLICDNFYYVNKSIGEELSNNVYSLTSTPKNKIKCLIPNHCLNSNTKTVQRFFPRKENMFTKWDESKKLNLAERLWKKQLMNYNNKYKKLILSLTGGYDSRVSLAMSRELSDEINYFTYTVEDNIDNTRFEKVAKLDEYLVKQILKDFNINHKFLYIDETKMFLNEVEKSVMDKNSIKQHGRKLIPFYNTVFPENDLIHIRGNLLEIGRAVFHDEKNSIDRIKTHMFKNLNKDVNTESFCEVLVNQNIDNAIGELKYNEQLFYYDVLDLYYWEIHMGKWFSEVLNETDSSFNTFLPFNMRAIIDISLSFSLENRKNDYFFNELINRNHPALNFYGKNTKQNLYEKFIKDKGSKKTFEKVSNIYFEHINSFNNKGVLEKKYKSNNNQIFIPLSKIDEGNYSEVVLDFKSAKGVISLKIQSDYISNKGLGYLQYEILKNEELLLVEDISLWNIENNIEIYNMTFGDQITVRVRALKNAKAKSWQTASTIKITNYNEIEMDKNIKKNISCTSPFSKI